jgi:AcrR family transcriptional regulator
MFDKGRQMKHDPRVRRTRQLLHEALLTLAVERGYDAITVQDILDRAEVARSTFYAHFSDKDDLLLGGFQEMSGSLPGNLFAPQEADHAAYPDFGLALFRHLDEHRALAKVFIGSDAGRIVRDHLRNLMVVDTREWLRTRTDATAATMPQELVVQYVVGALFGLLTWWVDHDFPDSADKMGAVCQQLVIAGLAGVFETA